MRPRVPGETLQVLCLVGGGSWSEWTASPVSLFQLCAFRPTPHIPEEQLLNPSPSSSSSSSNVAQGHCSVRVLLGGAHICRYSICLKEKRWVKKKKTVTQHYGCTQRAGKMCKHYTGNIQPEKRAIIDCLKKYINMSHSFPCTTTHYEGLCVLTNTQTYHTSSGHSLTSHSFPGHTTLYCTNTSTDTHTRTHTHTS